MITQEYFDTYQGKQSFQYTLSANVLQVTVCDFGAAVIAIRLNTKLGEKDICLSYPTIDSYIKSGSFSGATVGRIANRIKNARFSLNGKEYVLCNNEGNNQLHGGVTGFAYRFWEAEICGDVLKLTLTSENGDQGYPHNLKMTVEYEIIGNSLEIRFSAITDGDTVWAPTNHAYFNLDGENSGDMLSTLLKVNGDTYTLLDAEHISTGEVASVKDTPFDFTKFKAIGKDIDVENEQLVMAQGYDCNFILNGEKAAVAKSEESGVQLSVYTDLPALQFYSGNYLDGIGKSGKYEKRQGFCLEPQYIPNAVNIPHFETPLLKKGEIKQHYIRYEFEILD
jgi:aldose 1-epimerase